MIFISGNKKRELINEIRTEYNDDIENAKKKKITSLVANHNDIIDFLKGELYTEEYHFILELLQNAEDNLYDTNKPRVTFTIEPEKLIVQNNEVGFKKDNIVAICAVGPKSSTKRSEKGYIGHKGIGFKSIFSITNNPEIYSNGYNFKFNKLDDLGMINPIWIDNLQITKKDSQFTNFIFPYKDPEESFHSLKDAFNRLNPELLLFLDKLKILEIVLEGKKRTYEKVEDNRLISIGNRKWKLVKKSFKIPDNVIDKSVRRYITETEIVFAFPLGESEKSSAIKSCDVYAYFPLRSYGFNFTIQADFHTTANRESLIRHNVRNDWLINQMVDMVKYSIEIFKEDKFMKTEFYEYLPYKSDRIEEPFRKFVEDLHGDLKEYPFILTENNDWVIPSNVKIIDPEIRELFPKKDFKSIFEVDYEFLHLDIRENYSLEKYLKNLGAEKFTFEDFCDLLKNYEWVKKQGDKWFLKLFSIISTYYHSEFVYGYSYSWKNNSNINKIKNLRIYKLRNGEVVKNNNDCYYDIKDTGYGFESRLNLLIDVFKEALPKEKKLRELFEILDITIGDSDGIKKYLEYFYNSEKWKKESEDFLLNTILFLKKNSLWSPILYHGVQFKTKNGELLNPEELKGLIFLPKEYSGDDRLEKLLDNTENFTPYYISEDYLNRTIKNLKEQEKIKAEKTSWINFFKNYNIADGFIIHRKTEKIYSPKGREFKNITYKFEKFTFTEEESSNVSGRYTYHSVMDYYIPFVKLIIHDIIKKGDKEHAKIFLHYMDKLGGITKKYHKKHYGLFGKGKKIPTKIGSSNWVQLLIDSAVFPTQIGLKRPVNVYSLNQEMIEILGENKVIPIITIKLNKTFSEKLNICSKLSLNLILKILKEKKTQENLNKDEYLNIYRHLNDSISQDEIENLIDQFNEHFLIYLDKSHKFFAPKDLIWEDKNEILDATSNYAPLNQEYPELRDFFIGKLMVKESENDLLYINRLKEIAEMKLEDIDGSAKLIIINIYIILNEILKRKDIPELNRLSYLVKSNEILRFTSITQENIYINDKNTLYDFFKFHNVNFLEIPFNFYLKIPNLIEKANFQYFSETINTTLIEVKNAEVLKKWTNHVRFLLQFIKWYLHYKNHEYYLYCNNNLFKNFEKIECSKIDDLEVIYELSGTEIRDKSVIFYDHITNIIYINSSIIYRKNTVYNKLAITIDEIFKGHDLINFNALFFRFETMKDIETYFESLDMPPVSGLKIDYSFLEPPITPHSPPSPPQPPTPPGGIETDEKKAIGRQGEENALYHLRKLKEEEYLINQKEEITLNETDEGFFIEENNEIIFEATWENCYGEHSPPLSYDISFIEKGMKNYVEVKSTKSPDKQWFQITDKEWDLLLSQGERYYLFRVYNVVIGKVYNDDIKVIQNPLKEWKEGNLIAYPYKIQI